jgi:hypothetical protein
MVAGGCTEPVRLWLDRPAGNVYHRSCEALGYRPFATNGSACAFSKALSQVTANVFERVLNVRVNAGTDQEGTATAFTIDVDGREYLITAKHVFQRLRDSDKIDVFMNDPWAPLDVNIFRCADPIDIAALVPPHQLTVNFELPFNNANYFFGQDAYFLGFPYGIQMPVHGANGPYPLRSDQTRHDLCTD